MKGIVLAGGSGTRLAPMTLATSKQLLPIYDKPMIYYPISTLMLAGIREMLIITTPHDQPQFVRLLGDGTQWGVKFRYATQEKPEGIAQALIIGEKFIADENVALILGDNIFYGPGMGQSLHRMLNKPGATIFAYEVKDASAYGVLELDSNGLPLSIEEKPKYPKSQYAIPGIYFYDNRAPRIASKLEKSSRGEFEITDLHRKYLELGELSVEVLGREQTWIDAGTAENLFEVSSAIQKLQSRFNRGINYPEEVALNMGWLSPDQVIQTAEKFNSSSYGQYLKQVALQFRGLDAT